MRIFAVELSSRFGSVALVDGETVLSERRWKETFKSRQQLFDAIEDMAIDWDAVDHFVAGRGPGAFSGMRIAFSVVNALALAGNKPVSALNSGAALAYHFGAPSTVVVGDARRNQLWAGCFSGTELESGFQLMSPESFREFVPSDALVLSSEYDRLESLLADFKTVEPASSVFPSAADLGVLAHRRLEQGAEPELFEPLYMHPPVFIEPRFPA